MQDYKAKLIKENLDSQGLLPAPWIKFPTYHPYSMGWRMGGGEDYIGCFYHWLTQQDWNHQQRVAYFIQQRVPAAWLLWVYEMLFPVDEADFEQSEEQRMASYGPTLEALGFSQVANFAKDFNSPHWD